MLPGQYLRGGHQRRLPAVLGGKPDTRRRHHGLAAAHVALHQPVHGPAPGHVANGVVNGPALGLREREGQGAVKTVHIHRMARRPRHVLPPVAQQLQAAGQQKQLLKHQPPPRHLQRLKGGGKVDVLIGEVYITQLVLLPHMVGQHVLQQLPAFVQPLADGLAQHQLADAVGQGVHRHNPPGEPLVFLALHQRVHHLPPPRRALGLTVKNIGLPGVEGGLAVFLVEKRHVQHAAVVHRPEAHHGAPAGDAPAHRLRGDHGHAAGLLPLGELGDGVNLRPVLIGAGEVADQLLQCGDAHPGQSLGPLLADALDIPHVGL